MNNEKPYLEETKVIVIRKYNPNYGDDRVCECGHNYYRHFDSYDNMVAVGCKYCGCLEFKEKKTEIIEALSCKKCRWGGCRSYRKDRETCDKYIRELYIREYTLYYE